jgi:hypothetical protein
MSRMTAFRLNRQSGTTRRLIELLTNSDPKRRRKLVMRKARRRLKRAHEYAA